MGLWPVVELGIAVVIGVKIAALFIVELPE
jgi:hypothetical protein